MSTNNFSRNYLRVRQICHLNILFNDTFILFFSMLSLHFAIVKKFKFTRLNLEDFLLFSLIFIPIWYFLRKIFIKIFLSDLFWSGGVRQPSRAFYVIVCYYLVWWRLTIGKIDAWVFIKFFFGLSRQEIINVNLFFFKEIVLFHHRPIPISNILLMI